MIPRIPRRMEKGKNVLRVEPHPSQEAMQQARKQAANADWSVRMRSDRVRAHARLGVQVRAGMDGIWQLWCACWRCEKLYRVLFTVPIRAPPMMMSKLRYEPLRRCQKVNMNFSDPVRGTEAFRASAEKGYVPLCSAEVPSLDLS